MQETGANVTGISVGCPPWFEQYVTSRTHSKGCITQLSFCSTAAVPDEVWTRVQLAEQREAELRKIVYKQAAGRDWKEVKVPKSVLNNGCLIPLIGLGTWLGEKGQVRQAVYDALAAGYRHIDCASVYGNEDEVGDALERAMREGLLQREDLFICSKVWNTDHAAEKVGAACLRSLKALKLDYLDLYMIHWPVTGNVGPEVSPPIQETWHALEGLVDRGLVRSLGVSNFSAKKLGTIMSYARIPPAVCQVEVHPYHRNDALLAWCAARGIHVTAYSPLGSPDSESIFPRRVPRKLMEDPALQAIARRIEKNAGQVLIRWALQHGTSVIPKSTSRERIRGNLQVLDWELGEEDYRMLSTLPFQQRMVNGAMWLNPKGPYRTQEELWDEPEAGEGPAAGGGPAQELAEGRDSTLPGTQTQPSVAAALPPAIASLPEARVAVLNNGARMPLLGLGTWKSAPGQVRAAVEAAVKLGYRHIDCAEVYQNEHEVGEALETLLGSGVVKREELWVTSKVWNTNHAAPAVERALKRTLANLRLTYLDLYLIHWPATGNRGPMVQPSIEETWRALEGLVDRGLVRSLGVSNFSAKKLGTIMSYARIPPAVCQVEVHPYHRNDALLAWCAARGIHVTAYSPLGSPDSASVFKRDAPVLLQDPKLLDIAARVGRSPAQVLIRWALQHGTSVLPKSTSPQRIQENGNIWEWSLTHSEYAQLCELGGGKQYRMVHGDFLIHPSGPYTSLDDLWDE